MTRRDLISLAPAAAAAAPSRPPLIVPVHHVTDSRARLSPAQLARFSSSIWPEAVRDFRRCAIELRAIPLQGEVKRSPGGRPVFTGLKLGVINLILTDSIPMNWDKGRGLTGVTTRQDGFHLCLVALNHAHGHQIPFLSVNTCIHELLHVLLLDIYESRPTGWSGDGREFRIDWYATRLWLFHDGAAIRQSAQAYLHRLRPVVAARAS